MQHPPGGDAVHDDGLGGLRADLRRDGNEVAHVEHHALRPSADLGERRDALADLEARGRTAERFDDPDQVVAGDEGKRRLVVVPTSPHLLLGEGDPRRLDTDPGFGGPWLRQRRGAGGQRLGLADARQFHHNGGGHAYSRC